jgi:hypothetical protein
MGTVLPGLSERRQRDKLLSVGGIAFKVAIGGFLVWLSAQMGAFVTDILEKVRESVQASELLEIDNYIIHESGDDPGRVRAPADQAAFDRFLEEWFTASGRKTTRDRWDEPFVYFKIPSKDPRDLKYRITSKGPDKKLGTQDDIVLERDNTHATINHDPTKIADAALEQKKQLDREVAKRVNDLLREAPKKAESAPPRASTVELLGILKSS